jgi:hypothetical protein
MFRKLLALVLILGAAGISVGCEADGEIDDDGAKIEIDDD